MLNALRSIWRFAGKERANINKSLAVGFLYALFHMLQVGAIYYVILALVERDPSGRPAWTALGLLLVSIAGRTVCNYFGQLQQTHAGYFMVGNKRVDIGNKLKSVPMGYFNDNSLGKSPASPQPFWRRWRPPQPWCSWGCWAALSTL